MQFPKTSHILLPNGYSLRFHTDDFIPHEENSILAVMQWTAHNTQIQLFSEREARYVHQKITITLDPNTLVLELGILRNHARDIMTNTLNVDATFGEFCRKNWTHVYSLFPVGWLKNTDLYRSDEECIEYAWKNWKVKFWFCGPNVNCGIHNEHDCIEWHVGIVGDGRMEKFTDFDESTLIESWRMSPGQVHPIFALAWQKDVNGNPKYPPHRWFGWNTGDVWMVIEEYL